MRKSAISSAILAVGLLIVSAPATSQPTTPGTRARELGSQDSQRIVRLLEVKPGESVAAIGASVLFLLPELSTSVGPSGKIFVVDWDRTAIQGVDHRIEQDKLSNVTVILASGDDTLLPQTPDKVLLVNSYRLIENRQKFFEANRKYMNGRTRIAIIDYYRRPMRIGPPVRERVASHRVMRELQKFGYVLVDRHNISSYQYFLVYRLRSRRA